MGFERPITIKKVIQEIQSNNYILPAIQREFVWNTKQIEDLFDSLLKGYPIGSFLFWKVKPDKIGEFQFYKFMDHFHEKDFTHNEPIKPHTGGEVTAILDGQQRLTALNIGLIGHYADKLPNYWWNNPNAFPKRELYLNLIRPSEEKVGDGFEFSFLRKVDIEAEDGQKHWFKVSNILSYQNLNDVFHYCVENELVRAGDTYPSDTLFELWNVIHQKEQINFFLEEAQDLDKVLNIFIRVNSGGTPLSYSDMLLSIATAAWETRDARQEIYDLVDQLNDIGDGFDFDKDFVLKSGLILTDIPAIEFRVTNFNKENMLILEQNWDKINEALKGTAYLLASWGYNRQTLVSKFAVIPLAYFLYHINSPSNFTSSHQYKQSREDMLYWLRIAILKRTLSGPTDNTLRSIRKAMQPDKETKKFGLQNIIKELATTPKSLRFDGPELDGVMSYRYGQSYTFSVLSFLYTWLDYTQKFHMDHVFPRSMFNRKELSKRGIPEGTWHLWLDHANDLGNLQLLSGPENQSKSDEEFESWIKGECSTPVALNTYLQQHLIPDMNLSFDNFPEFLEKRTKLMRDKLAELLNVQNSENINLPQ